MGNSQYLVFLIDDQKFAFPSGEVVEVSPVVSITPLTLAHPMVEGVINYRGSVIPVLDLRAQFGLPVMAVRLHDHLIVAKSEGRLVAMRVDKALELTQVEEREIQPALGLVAGPPTLAGVARLSSGLVLIHDLAGLLSQAIPGNILEIPSASFAGGILEN